MAEGLTSLFPLAVALLDEGIGFFGNVFLKEVGIPGDDGFQLVVEHHRRCMEITTVAYPFRRPDGTDNVRMPMLPSVAVYNGFCAPYQVAGVIRFAKPREKDM